MPASGSPSLQPRKGICGFSANCEEGAGGRGGSEGARRMFRAVPVGWGQRGASKQPPVTTFWGCFLY